MSDADAVLPPDDPYARPAGVDDAIVEATGKLSEALEWVERARGHLYEFHQLMGHADLLLDEAVEALEAAGLADAPAPARKPARCGQNTPNARFQEVP